MSAQRPLHANDQGWVQGVRESFLSLNGSPRSLWLMFVLKCLESFAYFASCVVFTLFLSEDFGLTDGQGPVVVKTPVLQTAKELLTQKSFWRFLAFTMITINLKSVFRHLDATFPKYLVREFGDKVPKGSIYSINPFIIIGLVPVISALTQRYEHFDMIHFGSYISAASVFLMAISTSIWASIAFVVVLSLGEALWSPRFYDYTVSVAPRGKEGTFMALSSAPLFLSTLPVGALSGYLLEWYCPEKGPRDSKLMWGIIGMVTASSPLLITLFQGWVREPKHPGKGHDPTAEEDRSDREMDDVDVLVHADEGGDVRMLSAAAGHKQSAQ